MIEKKNEKFYVEICKINFEERKDGMNLRGRDGGADVCSRIRSSTSSA